MILQALYELYQRKCADAYDPLPPYGWEKRDIDYVLVIASDGTLKDIESTAGQRFLVPQGVTGRTSTAVKPNLLWDKASYAIGWDKEKSAATLQKENRAFIEKIHAIFPDFKNEPGLNAVCAFLENEPLEQIRKMTALWKEISESKKKGLTFSFRLQGEERLVCESPTIRDTAPEKFGSFEALKESMCLVTGEQLPVAKLHTMLKGVYKAQTSGAAIVTFNAEAYESYGKERGANAPVSLEAADAYTKALNWLLERDCDLKIKHPVGDTTVVFWAQNDRGKEFEKKIGELYGTDPEKHYRAVQALYDAPRKGTPPRYDKDTRFYVLGLAAPSQSRISVRFWHAAPIKEFAENIQHYFDDIALDAFVKSFVKNTDEKKWPMLWRMIAACAPKEKIDKLPDKLKDRLSAQLFESVTFGKPYPLKLMHLALTRVRAEGEVSDYRAAILKACLIRNFTKEITMGLDEECNDIGYLFGRLFAAFDKMKEEESTPSGEKKPRTNRRYQYFASFSSHPLILYPRLAELAEHDLKKLHRSRPGRAIQFEKLMQSIQSKLSPAILGKQGNLTLQEQALFVLGFYHQREKLFESPSQQKEAV